MPKSFFSKLFFGLIVILISGIMGLLTGFVVVFLEKLVELNQTPIQDKVTIILFMATGIVMGILIVIKLKNP